MDDWRLAREQDLIDKHGDAVFVMVACDQVGSRRTSAGAWPMATPKPALRIIGTSLTSSPTAQMSAGSTSQRFARCRTAVHLLASWRRISHIVPR